MREEGREWRRRGRGFFVGRVAVLVAVACVHRGTGLACGWGCSTREGRSGRPSRGCSFSFLWAAWLVGVSVDWLGSGVGITNSAIR